MLTKEVWARWTRTANKGVIGHGVQGFTKDAFGEGLCLRDVAGCLARERARRAMKRFQVVAGGRENLKIHFKALVRSVKVNYLSFTARTSHVPSQAFYYSSTALVLQVIADDAGHSQWSEVAADVEF